MRTFLKLTSIFVVLSFTGLANANDVEQGKKIAWDRKGGNCLACHSMKGGSLAGTIGPALVAMKLRYPDKQKLYDKIWGVEATEVEDSMMPLFGKNTILTSEDIKKVVEYLYTL